MTTAEALFMLARANLAASLATAIVLALRGPARRWFGPEGGYALWLAVPATVAGGLIPIGWTSEPANAVSALNEAGASWLADGGRATTLAAFWAAGFALSAALAGWRQARFAAAARAGRAGPAVVGFIRPRLVTPRDFAQRFTPHEQRLIRAHERAHMERLDGRWSALAELAAWACWFNPLARLAVRTLSEDQELACDAAVMRLMPTARRAYAQALLRSHVGAPQAALSGCGWRAPSHPLERRLAMLKRPPRGGWRSEPGTAATAALSLALFGAAWSLTPALGPSPRPALVVMELGAPDPALAASVYRWLPKH
jgi:beta-lactamase regulating signal transducer with metallopeptidase domain